MEFLLGGRQTEGATTTFSKVIPGPFILIGGVITVGIIFATVLLNSSYFFAGTLSYSVQSFIGIVGFPPLIIITMIITSNLL